MYVLDEMTAVCHRCFVRSVSMTTGRCPHCGLRWDYEPPDPERKWAEVVKKKPVKKNAV